MRKYFIANRLPQKAVRIVTDAYYIYALTDSNSSVKYIGKTTNPISRFRTHLCCRGKSRAAKWISKLIANNKRPKLFILEVTHKEIAEFRERYWINHFGINNLLNSNNGYIHKYPFWSPKYKEYREKHFGEIIL